MRRMLAVAWIATITLICGASAQQGLREKAARRGELARASVKSEVAGRRARMLDWPLAFEPSKEPTRDGAQLQARGDGMEVELGREGLIVKFAGSKGAKGESARGMVRIGFTSGGKDATGLKWKPEQKEAGETNYLIGRDARLWRTHVPRYGRAEAEVFRGVSAAAYGSGGTVEYDLRVGPGADLGVLGLQIRSAEKVRLGRNGDLVMTAAGRELRMRRPEVFEEGGANQRARIEGGYVMRAGGEVGFWVGAHEAEATIVIDPTLTLEYATFLGGAGGTEVNGAAVDAAGFLYVGGETEAGESFGGAAAQSQGVTGGGTYLFVAKLNPGMSGTASLEWLTFIGGSGSQAGGAVTADANGNLAVAGTTTSADYPVTDGSAMKSGANSAVVTELDQATGAKLEFSSVLGGSGEEMTENGGGVGIDASGNLYIASDTSSADLCTGAATTAPYQATYGGGATDGFMAMYSPGTSPPLRYCTFLGIFAEVGVTGLALDSKQNVYLTGFTSQPVNPTQFPSTANGFQANYGGGDYDGFVVKISPSGNGASDLSYATYLGATGSDKAMAIAVDSSHLPATAYVSGTTTSGDFPQGALAGYQTKQGAGAGGTNAFLAVVTQSAQPPPSGPSTQLAYSTYLGGLRSDEGMSVAEVAPNAVFVGGSASSTNFPWLNNLQPLNGDTDAFVAELDTTAPGSAGLKFATPLGGTPGPGETATTNGKALAVMSSRSGTGNEQIYVAGTTNASDFPQAPVAGGLGLELTCASCPGEAEGFAAEILEVPTGTSGAAVSFDPAVVRLTSASEFAPVNVGIENTGDGALTITSVTLSQAGSDFSLQPASPCSGLTIQAGSGGLCTFQVSFTPSGTETEGATIFVVDDAPGETQELQVAGISALPDAVIYANLQQGALQFGDVPVGGVSPAQKVTLVNAGGQALTTNFMLGGSKSFAVAPPTSSCSTLEPGQSCGVLIEFSPLGTGVATGALTFTDNSGNVPGATQTVTLTGNGVSGTPGATVEPGTLDFGSVAVGVTSAPQEVTLKNSGSSTLDVSGASVSGGGFAMASGAATNCPVGGGTLAPGASCTVGVTFTPGTSGAAGGSLNFLDNAGGGEQSVALSGTGTTAGTVSVAPGSVTFAPQSVGTTSAATNVTLTNTGTTAVTITSIGMTGAEGGDFGEASNCGTSVPAGKTCVVQVTFSPTATGNRSATLSLADSASGSPQTVALSGVGTQAAVKLSATSVTFSAAQLIGTASTAQTVTATNTGTGALDVSKITFPGQDGADFSETDNCSGAGGVTIAAGQSCTINIVFKPQEQSPQCGAMAGARCATMTIADNAPGSPQTVTLAGSAMDFEIAPPAGGSLAQTVTAGGTATYNLEIDSSGGFTGTVGLACGEPTAITGTNCSMGASSVNVAANGAGTFTVSVKTTAPDTAASWKVEKSNWKVDGSRPLALFSILALGLGWVLSGRRRRGWIGATAAVALAIAFAASCGGGGGSTATDPPGTLPGTYANAVTVTATFGTGTTAATRTAQLTLIVQ